MNLHDVVRRALRGTRFEHSAPAWACVVRASQGKAHIYEMPVKNGRLACTVWAALYGDEVPTPACGAKPRNTAYPFSRMYAENAGARPWGSYCRECNDIDRNVHGGLRYSGYWANVTDEAALATFYAAADRDAATFR